jgi:uncharacterized protein (DUF2062 family)
LSNVLPESQSPVKLGQPVVDPVPSRPGFWQRKVRGPLITLLTHGTTPEKLATGIAWAVVCSLFPFFGFTTGLNAAVAFWRKLNQPLMQAMNYVLSPLHLLMILVYVRTGEWLWQSQGDPFSVTDMMHSFKELSFGAFLHKFAWAGIHAFTAWALSAPLLFVIAYYPARTALRRLAHLLPAEKCDNSSTPPAS